ncbi:hypothetical protein Tco_0077464 [Tanacetum coccineum]
MQRTSAEDRKLGKLINKAALYILVQWSNNDEDEDTWEVYDDSLDEDTWEVYDDNGDETVVHLDGHVGA